MEWLVFGRRGRIEFIGFVGYRKEFGLNFEDDGNFWRVLVKKEI